MAVLIGFVSLPIFGAEGVERTSPGGTSKQLHVFLQLSPFGVGLSGGVELFPMINLRAGINFAEVTFNRVNDGIHFDGRLDLYSGGAFLDFAPYDGNLHFTLGALLNRNLARGAAFVPAGERFTLGDREFTSDPSQPIFGMARAEWPRLAPAAFVGWGNPIGVAGRHFFIEAGAIYQGAPGFELLLQGNACAVGGLGCVPVALLHDEVLAQAREIALRIADYKFMPIINFGFAFKL